jgi:ribosomal RNA methyltransferase Nop2
MLPIERQEARLRKKQKKAAQEGEQEMQLNLDERERFVLPTGDEVAREEREGLELQTAQQRIQDVLRVLGNFSQEREEGKSREEYVKQLKRDLAFYYGYNKFLISQILRLFSPPEAVEFLEANETPRPVTIRCNTLKVEERFVSLLSAHTLSRSAVATWRSLSLREE